MRDIEKTIEAITRDVTPLKPIQPPGTLARRLTCVLLVYALIIALVLGVRADIVMQLQRVFFLMELLLLIVIVAASLRSATLMVFPDQYQQKFALGAPLLSMVALVFLLLGQGFLPADARMALPAHPHRIECSLCIAMVAVAPSALMFAFLRRGASVSPLAAGAYATLAATAVGCFMLRIAEPNDSLAHLVSWHYLPTLLFAAAGAFIGKKYLKW